MFQESKDIFSVSVGPWHEGFQKVSATKLFQELGYSLSDAKSKTDSILNNELFVISFDSRDEACEFAEKISELGVDAKVED